MSIGKRIYELRQFLGLNQTDFGRPILLSQTTVGQMENETRIPTERTIVLIIDKWHCSGTWLRTGDGEMFEDAGEDFLSELSRKYVLNAFQQSLVRAVYELPPDYQDMILALARRLVAENEETDYERTERIVNKKLDEYEGQQARLDEDKQA